jgi:putative tricarboxylic transport membrane protein
MWVGNLMLVIINLPMIGMWVSLLRVPYRLMFPAIVLFCCIGIFSISNKPEQLMITAAFGLFGYLLHKLEFEAAPLALGFVLGQLLEEKMRQALIISNGDPTVFVATPLSGTLLAVGLSALVLAVLPSMRRSREEVFRED